MADDAATVEALRAELRRRRECDSASQAEVAALRADNAALRDQQTALGDVLRVIASSPTDVQRVLDTIVETAARLCDAEGGVLQRLRERDGRLAPRAVTGNAVAYMLERFGANY